MSDNKFSVFDLDFFAQVSRKIYLLPQTMTLGLCYFIIRTSQKIFMKNLKKED